MYERQCRSSIRWFEVGEAKLLSPNLVQEAQEKVKLIRERLLAVHSRQKDYVENRRCEIEFTVGDQVFMKVLPIKGLMRFGKKGKLSLRYIGPFEILQRVSKVAYQLALPPEMENVHPMFHISMLGKYLPDPRHVIKPPEVQLDKMLSYEEVTVGRLHSKEVLIVKVIWCNYSQEEATWEAESEMQAKYPHLFKT